MFLLSPTERPDVEPPVFDNCPLNVTRLAPVGQNFTTVVLTGLSASDNSRREVAIERSRDPSYAFSVGSEVVIYTATDPSGNSANCSVEVIVIRELT